MIAMEINLNITMTYHVLEVPNVHVNENKIDSNRQRKTPSVIRNLLSSPKNIVYIVDVLWIC